MEVECLRVFATIAMHVQVSGDPVEHRRIEACAFLHSEYINLTTWQHWHLADKPAFAVCDMHRDLAVVCLVDVLAFQTTQLSPAQSRSL